MSPSFTVYEAGTFLDRDGDTKVCLFFILPIMTLLFVGDPAMLPLRAMKRQTLLPSLLWICLVSRLGYSTLTLNSILTNIFFPQDDWNGAVTNKLHSVKPFLGNLQSSYRQCRKNEVVLCRAHIGHTHLTHSYILKKDPPPQYEHCQCILTMRHILVECNHFAEKKRMYLVREI